MKTTRKPFFSSLFSAAASIIAGLSLLRPVRELAFRPVFRTARDQRREVKAERNANPWKGSPL